MKDSEAKVARGTVIVNLMETRSEKTKEGVGDIQTWWLSDIVAVV